MNDSMQNTADRKPFLLLLIAAAVCFIMYKLLLMPLFDQLALQSQQRDLLQRELQQYQEFASEHQDYDTFLKQRLDKLEQLQRRLPEQVVFSEQLKWWQQLAQSSDVKISEIKLLPAKETDSKQMQIQPVRINLDGNYYAVLKFMRELKKSENFVNIDKVNIIGNENKGDIKFTAVFNIYMYHAAG